MVLVQVVKLAKKKAQKNSEKGVTKLSLRALISRSVILIMLEHYSQPEELLADGTFLNWYFKTGEGEAAVWEEWMAADPRNRALALQAVELLELTRLPEKKISAEQIRQASERLMAGIARLGDSKSGDGGFRDVKTGAAYHSRRLPFYGRGRWIAAACALFILVAGMMIYRSYHPRDSEIRTEYGQLGDQLLPDGTEVTMNANSRLRYVPGWKAGADREVWVNGEAFFHVVRTPEKSRFIVHLDDCDVIVTGTRFNVVNRPGKENIMLQEGAVMLRTAGGKELGLLPGDFVAVGKNGMEKLSARPDSLMAWKERRLFFYYTPLPELVNIVYDQYGVRLQLAGDSTAKKTVTGILRNNSLEELLKALEMTKEFEVIGKQDSGGITIVARPTRN
jgi:ferric-dicitrate binding protein FerR (iron transport regulator)